MIKVKNLRFTYPKSTRATLKDISFEINEGEIFGFLGPSGGWEEHHSENINRIIEKL